jgi:DNA anti-recombination protein RmuC
MCDGPYLTTGTESFPHLEGISFKVFPKTLKKVMKQQANHSYINPKRQTSYTLVISFLPFDSLFSHALEKRV